MRGSNALIKIHQRNVKIFKLILTSYCIFMIIIIGLVLFRNSSLLVCLLLFIPDIICLYFLKQRSRPHFINSNGLNKLVSVEKIDEIGINSILFDILFWSMLGHTVVCFTWNLSCIYLGILFSIANEFLYKPYKQIKNIFNKKID